MSAEVATQNQNRASGPGKRGNSNRPPRGGNRGSNRTARPGAAGGTPPQTNDAKRSTDTGAPAAAAEPAPAATRQPSAAAAPLSDAGEEVCWICAEPVKYYSVSECNHRTCHVCALRLRALYKKTQCTFCKVRGGWTRCQWYPSGADADGTDVGVRLGPADPRHIHDVDGRAV
jgi:hypothetical protein